MKNKENIKSYNLTKGLKLSDQEFHFFSAAANLILKKSECSEISDIALQLLSLIDQSKQKKLAGKNIENIQTPKVIEKPVPDKFKAAIIKGMFITFSETGKNIPGLFQILKGILATSLGIGNLTFTNPDISITQNSIDSALDNEAIAIIKENQKQFLIEQFSKVTEYASIQRGAYCNVLACSLLPIYTAAFMHKSCEDAISEHHVQKAFSQLKIIYAPRSIAITKLFSQNMFASLFDSLFSSNSTRYSLF